MQKLQIILFLLLVSQLIYPAEYKPTAKYTISNDLSNSEITSLFIDSHQFLWIGTTDGLNRFDGYHFRKYYSEITDSSSLPDDNILAITEDSHGNIWCATATSIVEHQKKDDTFKSFFLNNDLDLTSQSPSILDMVIDKAGERIFVLGRNFFGSINTLNKKIGYYIPKDKISEFKNLELTSIDFNNQQKRIILSNSTKIFIYTPENNSIQLVANLPQDLSSEGGIQNVISGRKNICYFCSNKHIWQLDIVTHSINLVNLPAATVAKASIINYISLSKDEGIRVITNTEIYEFQPGRIHAENNIKFNIEEKNKYSISSEVKDSSGIWWIGTDKGLFKFNPHKNVFNNIYLNDFTNVHREDFINLGSFIDNSNILLVLNLGRILNIDSKERTIQQFKSKIKTSEPHIYSIDADKFGDQLICTSEGLILLKGYNKNLKNFNIEEKILEGNPVFAAVFDNDSVWAEDKTGVFKINIDNKARFEIKSLSDFLAKQPAASMKCSEKYLWIQQNQRVIEYDKKTKGIYVISIPRYNNYKSSLINAILPYKDSKLFIGTSDGLFLYSGDTKNVTLIDSSFRLANSFVHTMEKSKDDKIWLSTNEGLILFDVLTGKERLYNESDGLYVNDFKTQFSSISPDGQLIFGGSEDMVVFRPDSIILNLHIPKIEFTESQLSGKNIDTKILLDNQDTLIVGPEYKNIKIEFTALDFWDAGKNQYMVSFEKKGNDEKWENIATRNYISLSDLSPGNYKLLVRGSNNDGIWCETPKLLIILVKGSYWRNSILYVACLFLLIILFYSAVFFRTRHFRSLNKKYLERERVTQKIEQQREELSQKNKNITDSLNYARRIQMALMPSQKIFTKFFPDSFILHIPKDIVSGDFYWVNEVDNRIYFAAVDCTGHGVPGAFMSIIGFELFRRITEMDKKKQPAVILNSLSRGFEHIFRDVENYTLRDGMDVAFCAIDKNMMVLEYAGAFNPLYLVRENTITEIKGDRFSVGLYGEENQVEFKNHVIPLMEGDLIYIFTDGFADQFGGPEGKKYKYRRFRHLLLALHQLPMERQVEFLRRSINDWRGELDQVDDVLVLGVRIQQSTK